MCGKYYVSEIEDMEKQGSPPHVREILFHHNPNRRRGGITPACAGNTHNNGESPEIREDHPRMCGKYPLQIVLPLELTGSPPHVREIPSVCIPFQLSVKDHPRMCGKYLTECFLRQLNWGSPPHVREIH